MPKSIVKGLVVIDFIYSSYNNVNFRFFRNKLEVIKFTKTWLDL